MPRLTWIAALLSASFAIVAHAEGLPTELKLDHPDQRRMAATPGKTLEAMQRACPVSLLNAAPATEAHNITEHILRQEDEVVIEVDAELSNVAVGNEHKTLPVTYRCEYRDGLMTVGVWTRGMVGDWSIFRGATLGAADLGAPWPN